MVRYEELKSQRAQAAAWSQLPPVKQVPSTLSFGGTDFSQLLWEQNIHDKVSALTSDQIKQLKVLSAAHSQHYDFNQQPATPKSSSPSYPPIPRAVRQLPESDPVKREVKNVAPLDTVDIPTFVGDFSSSSPENEAQEQEANEQQSQVLYMDGVPMTLPPNLGPGQYFVHQTPDGGMIWVECEGSPSSSEAEVSPSPEVPETTIETAPQEVRAGKRSAPVEEEGMTRVVVSGKRVCEESQEETRGPVQVSSPGVGVDQKMPPLTPMPQKTTIEVAPQLRSESSTPKQPAPATPQPPASIPVSPYPPPPTMMSAYSPLPSLSHSSQYRTDVLIHDLHTRIRERINYMQSLTLGDVELSIKINTMYQAVLWNHFQRAQKNEANQFINAVHACEALVERAIVEGNNFSRDAFKDDCEAIIQKYSGEPDVTQKLVLTVAEPEHPPIQRDRLTEILSSKTTKSLPSPSFPKSPGTFLSSKLDSLQLDRSQASPATQETKLTDVTKLGIRTKLQPQEMLQHLGELVQHRPQQTPTDEKETTMILPEKLMSLRGEVKPEETRDENLKDVLKQLEELKKLEGEDFKLGLGDSLVQEKVVGGTEVNVAEQPEVIVIDDENACDDTDTVNLQNTEGPPDNSNFFTDNNLLAQIAQKAGIGFNNPAPAESSWHQAEREMIRGMNVQPQVPGAAPTSECDMDIDSSILDNVLGLEQDYERFDVDWGGHSKSSQPAMNAQPSSSDEGRFSLAPGNFQQAPPPYPGTSCFWQSDGYTDGNNPDMGQSLVDETGDTFQAFQEMLHCQPSDNTDTPALQLHIPEVVENFSEQMECESEPKPGTRGRKRNSKGKARK